MADYPTLPQLVGSQKLDDDGRVLDLAESGKPRLRQYYTQVRTQFNILHEVDGSDKDTIVSHYNGDSANVFNFTFKGDGVTYSVRYLGVPQTTPVAGTDRWRVQSRLIVV